jgi:hypothetical protein
LPRQRQRGNYRTRFSKTLGRKEPVEGGTGQLSCSCPAQKSKNFVSRARTTPLRSVVLFPPKTKRTEPLPCREDRVACGRCRSAACPVVGGSAEDPNAQGGCDKSRVKTKKKEKQNDFLTKNCHRKTFERGSGPLPRKEKHGRSLREVVAAVARCPPRASVCWPPDAMLVLPTVPGRLAGGDAPRAADSRNGFSQAEARARRAPPTTYVSDGASVALGCARAAHEEHGLDGTTSGPEAHCHPKTTISTLLPKTTRNNPHLTRLRRTDHPVASLGICNLAALHAGSSVSVEAASLCLGLRLKIKTSQALLLFHYTAVPGMILHLRRGRVWWASSDRDAFFASALRAFPRERAQFAGLE